MSSMTLSLKGQMAHVSCIALFSPEMATTLHSKTFKNSKKQSFILDILPFSDFFKIFHFGRNGVKFHKSFLLKRHTCTQHIGDHNFQKTIASAPGSICWNDIIKKIVWLNWVRFIKWVNFSKFSKFNIFVIFEDRASFIIAGK